MLDVGTAKLGGRVQEESSIAHPLAVVLIVRRPSGSPDRMGWLAICARNTGSVCSGGASAPVLSDGAEEARAGLAYLSRPPVARRARPRAGVVV
eukprot:762521-Hanusia_phi.AAC.40